MSDYSLKYSMESFIDAGKMEIKCPFLISICLRSTIIKNKRYGDSNMLRQFIRLHSSGDF